MTAADAIITMVAAIATAIVIFLLLGALLHDEGDTL